MEFLVEMRNVIMEIQLDVLMDVSQMLVSIARINEENFQLVLQFVEMVSEHLLKHAITVRG
jgi:hypothetical protein